jgi:leucyl aminopeptidase
MLPNQFEPVSLAKKISKEFDNTIANIEIMDCEEMIEQKLLACVAVNNGSKKEPQFITITIPATIKSEQNLVVVGKCLYDVGGLALKDAPGQREMYIDKGGAATALGLAVYFAQFPLPDKNLVFLIPAVRNEVSDTSYTNGSVIPVGLCYPDLGKNVEIGNTDAEGRLTLADAVAWGQVKYKAKQIITLATLTGASLRAHGNGVASIFYNRNDTKDKIMSSFVQHQEQAEFFPYRVRYVGLLKPDNGVAALSNISSFGQIAGHHTAAEFVRKFIADDVDLTHVDFAGPVIDKKGVATGYGVRSLVGFLEG